MILPSIPFPNTFCSRSTYYWMNSTHIVFSSSLQSVWPCLPGNVTNARCVFRWFLWLLGTWTLCEYTSSLFLQKLLFGFNCQDVPRPGAQVRHPEKIEAHYCLFWRMRIYVCLMDASNMHRALISLFHEVLFLCKSRMDFQVCDSVVFQYIDWTGIY